MPLGGGYHRQLRKTVLFGIGVLIIFLSIIGITYGYWINSETQNTFDILGVKCFELTMSNETKGIHLEEAYPVTDEEGKEQEGYTFKVKNTCNTTAYYQVNLEEKNLGDTKRLDGEYIKVSLNDSQGKNLDTYQETEATISEKDFQADDSHILTTGSLGPNEETDYTLKLWMDEETPPIEDVMNATFESKISVVATYIEEEKRNNTITIAYEEQNEYTKDKETVTFTATSEKEDINITEYSLDGTSYNSLDKPSTNVILPLDFTEEKEYNIYFKDAMGNKKEQEFETKMLDQTGPTIDVTETSDDKGAVLNIKFEDLKSGLKEYRIEDGVSSIDLEEEWTEFTEENEQTIIYPSSENKKIHIYAKDKLDNLYDIEFTITKADTKGPELTIDNPSKDTWSNTSITITLSATDDISGVEKFYYSTDNSDWKEIETFTKEDKNANATLTIFEEGERTIYIKAEDKLGNESEVQETTVKIDLSAPTQEFGLDNNSVKGDNDWYKNASITVTGTDTGGSNIVSGSYCEGTSNCEPDTPFNETSKTIQLTNGTNKVVCVTFTDNAGNTSNKTCSQTYNVDGEKPNLSNAIAQSTWGNTNSLSGTAIDGISGIAGYEFSTNITPSNWTSVEDFPTNAQNYSGVANSNTTYYFHVKDQAGNVNSTSIVVSKVDNTAPNDPTYVIQSQTSGTSGSGWYQALKLRVTVSDSQSGVSSAMYCVGTSDCKPNLTAKLSGSETSKNFDVDFGSNANAQKVCVTVTDGVGLTKTKCNPTTYKVDGNEPDNPSFSIVAANGSNGWYKTARPTLTVTVKDSHSGVASAKYCTTTSAQCNNYTSVLGLNGSNGGTTRTGTISLPEGNGIKACVQVTDVSGKTSALCSSGYKVDITPPTIGSATGRLSGTSIIFTANSPSDSLSGVATAAGSYSWKLSNNATQTSEVNTATFTGLVKGQSYTATVTVKDNAGNVSNSVTSGSVAIPYPTIAETLGSITKATSGDGLYEVTPTLTGWTSKELRYAGKDPSNYVTFNNETWRIIGLVNVKTTSGVQQRIKIIRKDSIGDIAWNISGINDWTQASLMKELNEGTFYTTTMNVTAKGMIATDIIWNLGGTASYDSASTGLVTHWYGYERGTTVYKNSPTEWNPRKQSIALPYPSDYGYATSGGTTGRTNCFAKELFRWNSMPDCGNNDWLKPLEGSMWTLPSYSSDVTVAFNVYSSGYLSVSDAWSSASVWPALYLSPSVKISGGTGASGSPYTLSV